MSDYDKGQPPNPAPTRRRRRLLLILGGVCAAFIVVIALAVGLGVGLSRHNSSNNNNSNGAGSSSSSTMSPVPSVTSTPSNAALWQPPVNASWQIVLSKPLAIDLNANTVTPDVDVFDIDLFGTDKTTIDHLHKLGKHVLCYFSAGSYEPGRPDSDQFQAGDKGSELDGWPGEYWLKLDSPNVRNIMTSRIQLAAQKGCDGIDPDNVDGYNNQNGIGLTEQNSIDYIGFLSDTAKQYNIATGLKNAGDIISHVLDKTAFNVNEQCVEFSECDTYQPFISAGKPVFHIEYPKQGTNSVSSVAINTVNNLCATEGQAAGSHGFSTIIKNLNLDGWAQFCSGSTCDTPVSSGAASSYSGSSSGGSSDSGKSSGDDSEAAPGYGASSSAAPASSSAAPAPSYAAPAPSSSAAAPTTSVAAAPAYTEESSSSAAKPTTSAAKPTTSAAKPTSSAAKATSTSTAAATSTASSPASYSSGDSDDSDDSHHWSWHDHHHHHEDGDGSEGDSDW